MECCICFDKVKLEEAYKFWQCDNHYTCRQCGYSLKNCPLCRAPTGSYIPKTYAPFTVRKIREDWKEEAIKRKLWNAQENISINKDCIIEWWDVNGRSLMNKRWAIKMNKKDIRLSW